MTERIKRAFAIYKNNFFSIILLVLSANLPIILARKFVVDPNVDFEQITDVLNGSPESLGITPGVFDSLMQSVSKTFYVYLLISAVLSLLTIIATAGIAKITEKSIIHGDMAPSVFNPVNNETGEMYYEPEIKNYDEYIAKDYGFSECFEDSIRNFPRALLAMLFGTLIAFLGMCLCFIPGLIIFILTYFTVQAAVLRGLRAKKAFGYSSLVARGHLLSIILLILITAVLSYFLGNCVEIIAGMIESSVTSVVIEIVLTALTEIFLAGFDVYTAVLFLDYEKRIPEQLRRKYFEDDSAFNQPFDQEDRQDYN